MMRTLSEDDDNNCVIPNFESIKSTKIGSEIVSNLELQMALYFNSVFFPFWLVTVLFFLHEKYSALHDLPNIITTVVLITLMPIEGFRLYLGYIGNLSEKIPELAGFWMLSLLLQLPLQIILLLSKGNSSSAAEKSVYFVMFVMLIIELIFGFIALKQISYHRANNFHLMQLHWNDTNGTFNKSRHRNGDFKKLEFELTQIHQ